MVDVESTSCVIDLRSDTVTKPTSSMRQAMAAAAVGDDVYREDPTVQALEGKVAALLEMEAALFVPSGTMANLIACMVHCNKRGSEMLCGSQSHMFKGEQGNISQMGGVLVSTVKNLPDGTFDLKDLGHRLRGADLHEPITMMIAIENTQNLCGGKVLPLAFIDEIAALAHKHSLKLHVDGARLFNASEYMREEPARLVKGCHSASVCFSKGLGAPVGSALVGSFQFIEEARRLRKALGGGMRQAGVLAAAAIVGLDEILPNLYYSHRRALYLGKAIRDLKLPSFKVDTDNQHTNIMHLNIDPKCKITSQHLVDRLALVSEAEITSGCKTSGGQGIVVRAGKITPQILRLVMHHEVNDEGLRLAIRKLTLVLQEFEGYCD